MAKRKADGSIELSNGKEIFADTPLVAQDLVELIPFLTPPQHFVAFTGRGGSSAGASGGPGGGGGTTESGARGFQGPEGDAGADGAGGVQGNQGNQGPAAPGAATLATGTYVGDDTNGRVIPTGLTSPIKWLQIFVVGPNSTVPAPVGCFKPGTVVGSEVGLLKFGATFTEENLVNFVANNFAVDNGAGAPNTVNALGTTYHWAAWA